MAANIGKELLNGFEELNRNLKLLNENIIASEAHRIGNLSDEAYKEFLTTQMMLIWREG